MVLFAQSGLSLILFMRFTAKANQIKFKTRLLVKHVPVKG